MYTHPLVPSRYININFLFPWHKRVSYAFWSILNQSWFLLSYILKIKTKKKNTYMYEIVINNARPTVLKELKSTYTMTEHICIRRPIITVNWQKNTNPYRGGGVVGANQSPCVILFSSCRSVEARWQLSVV